MNTLNKVMLIGNLTRDPEIRQTSKGVAVTDLGIAINRVYNTDSGERQEEVTFVDVTLWERLAENAAKYLSKGRAVFVEGRLKLDSWEDKETGQNRQRLRVVGERLQFLGGGRESDERRSDAEQADASSASPGSGSGKPGRNRNPGRRQTTFA